MKDNRNKKEAAPAAYTFEQSDDQSSRQKVFGLAMRRAYSVSEDEAMSQSLEHAIKRLKKARGET